jgi:hypothetical protein
MQLVSEPLLSRHAGIDALLTVEGTETPPTLSHPGGAARGGHVRVLRGKQPREAGALPRPRGGAGAQTHHLSPISMQACVYATSTHTPRTAFLAKDAA